MNDDVNETNDPWKLGGVPRGIEVLLKKASVDLAFKELLLSRRAEAAQAIGLTLTASEVVMLQSVAADQLEGLIRKTKVPKEHRRVFLGWRDWQCWEPWVVCSCAQE